jgi:surfeit locus 1 family protein
VSLKIRFWLITCAAAVGIAITASLGVWQLGRATQKEALQAAIAQQSALSAVSQATLLASADAMSLVHRRAIVSGTWLPQHTVFLDNRQMDAKPGFYVLTPFDLADQARGAKKVILVQRGWVARHFLDRTQVPAVPTPSGVVTLEGRIAPPPSKLYAFKGADNGLIRQNIDVPEFAQQIQRDFLSVSLLQTDAVAPSDMPSTVVSSVAPDGLLRHWPQPNNGVEKHYGYMAQWWALSALIAILYVWFQIVRPKLTPKLTRQD